MEAIIQCRGLSKYYKPPLSRGVIRALDGLTLEVYPGEIFGLLGPNGSGKTTTLKLILGLIFPTKGEVKVFGKSPLDPGVKARIGFVPDGPYFYGSFTAEELLLFYGRLLGMDDKAIRRRTGELLEFVGLKEFRTLKVAHYSKGMLQRLGIAQALLNDPDLLLLDEPTAGLDPIGAKEIRQMMKDIRDRGKTVFMCSHLLIEAQGICDRVAILNEGKLIKYGPVKELVSPSKNLEDVFVEAVTSQGGEE
ncbi:MAG TPA: ABC transporter ATP-binding protein [Armatimonadetes bacterium]|nr:ABC transporter ATP-binding protein [Armatimonadota bacterium]